MKILFMCFLVYWFFLPLILALFSVDQARKRSANPNFWAQISSGGWGFPA